MDFNPQQLQAIQTRNKSILVSAPAGSGKTRVLVTRIAELLKEGISVDELLVLTFTDAAASEMKQRLSLNINDLLSDENLPVNIKDHLSLQQLKLDNAYITNFHTFCSTLLKKYGYLIDVNPGFKVLSDNLAVKSDVFNFCMNKWLMNDVYSDFFRIYFPGYNFDTFQKLFFNVESTSHSINDFNQYVDQIYSTYYQTLDNDLNHWPIVDDIKVIIKEAIFEAEYKLVEFKAYCESNDLYVAIEPDDTIGEKSALNDSPYMSRKKHLRMLIDNIDQCATYNELWQLCSSKPSRAYSMPWKKLGIEDGDPVKKGYASSSKVLDGFNDTVKKYLDSNTEDLVKKIQLGYKPVKIILDMLEDFNSAYALEKKRLDVLDFNDLESKATLLLNDEYGIVQKLNKQIKEIMVDEYQDTNQIQENLILKISNGNHHIPMFMVGDMKQSIYRFRQADPKIFKDKYDRFVKEENDELRIDLAYNYRSHKVVLDSINYIFNSIMDNRYGGLEYYKDSSAQLNYDYSAKHKDEDQETVRKQLFNAKDHATELLLAIKNKESSLDKDEIEAHMVAQKIQSLMTTGIDDKPLKYKDICILMRSATSFLTFKKVFDMYDIPNHIMLSQGLTDSVEYRNMLTFLKAIQDPYNDIALMSVIRGPYTISNRLTLDLLSNIRVNHKKEHLYTTLKNNKDTNKEVSDFLDSFNALLEYAKEAAPSQILQAIYQTTDYPLFVSQLLNGVQRKANLDLLYELVLQNQKDYPYLDSLIEYFDKGSDHAPAPLNSDSNDMVEFMTIHKSKGLEFPVVFVSQIHKGFNMSDASTKLIIDRDKGFAMNPKVNQSIEGTDYSITVSYENLYHKVLSNNIRYDAINEEMRILYVAMTRAVNKLIITGVINDINDISNVLNKLGVNYSDDITHSDADAYILYDSLRNKSHYLDWILAATLRTQEGIQYCMTFEELKDAAKKLSLHANIPVLENTEHAMFDFCFKDALDIESLNPGYTKKHLNTLNIDKYLAYQYPYDITKREHLAVTKLPELYNMDALEDDHHVLFDDIDEEVIMKATDKGTLVHLLMSELSFNNDNVDSAIKNLYLNGLCSENDLSVLEDYKENIQRFIESDYYKEISTADYIYKEKPFTYYDHQLDTIINGIFDLVYIINDHIYVLDYKTDRISDDNSEKALIDAHHIQLEYYKKILNEMYQKPVTAIVYYLHKGIAVEF